MNWTYFRKVPAFESVGQNIWMGMNSKDKPGCPVKAAVLAWWEEVRIQFTYPM